jgi:penicillin-binding protein 1A
VASVQPGDGAVRVLYGGLDPNRKFDVSSQGRRQPGSSFKPFLYVAALESGIDPRSLLDSGSPKTVPCAGAPWTVKNYEGEGRGQISVDQAMAHSVNTVFQQLMADVGPATLQRTAVRFGIPQEALTPARCAMALGGLPRGVSPLEQAAAYATFAAKGIYAQPYAIARIKNRAGEVVYQHTPKTARAIPEKEAGVVNATLQHVVGDGTGTAAAIGRPLAGKTGTTEDNADAWFIGYVPQLSSAVWVGYPDALVPMTDVHGTTVAGGGFPARIFGRFMRAALAGVPIENLATASPDELALHLLNAPPPAPPTTPPPPSTTTTPSAPPPPGGPPHIDGEPRQSTPEPGPAPGGNPQTQQQVPSPQPRQTTTTRPMTTTTIKQKATAQTTIAP